MIPTPAKRFRRGSIILATTSLLGLSLVTAASAQPKTDAPSEQPANPALGQIQALNGEAVTAFGAYSFKKGLQKLEEAVELARKSKLENDPGLAPTYVLLAMGVIAGRDDLYRGLHYFVHGLRLKKKVGMPRSLVTPQILRVYRSAKKAITAIGNPPQVKLALYVERVQTALDTVRKDARGLVHEPVDEAKFKLPIPVTAVAGVDIRATKFYLYFRAAGKVKYDRLPMKLSRGAYRAAIPAKATKGRYVHYYIEARDQRGRVAASNGSERSPNVVTIKYF